MARTEEALFGRLRVLSEDPVARIQESAVHAPPTARVAVDEALEAMGLEVLDPSRGEEPGAPDRRRDGEAKDAGLDRSLPRSGWEGGIADMLSRIHQAVLDGNIDGVGSLVDEALHGGASAQEILETSLTPAMDVVGQEYEEGIRFIPEMLIAAETMKAAMKTLRPLLMASGVSARGKVVIGTVTGDLHDIGKNLVGMMLEGAGFEVIDLGVEVAAERFVEAVREHRPDLLCLSALLTTTMVHMPEVVDALTEAGVRETVQVLIGGAPIAEAFAGEIGVDGFAPDAAAAVPLAKRLVESSA